MKTHLLYRLIFLLAVIFFASVLSASGAGNPGSPYYPQVLDSVAIIDNGEMIGKRYMFYNEQGGLILAKEEYYERYGNYSPRYEYTKEYVYDNQGNMIFYTFNEWNPEYNEWRYREKAEYAYDSRGNRICDIYYDWNYETNDWKKAIKYDRIYNDEGLLALYILSGWEPSYDKWMEYDKTEYTRNEYGNVILLSCYTATYDYLEWVLSYEYKHDCTYDKNENLLLDICYRRTSASGKWVENDKSEFTYDKNNKRTLYVHYNWENDWKEHLKEEYSYGTDDLLIVIDYVWYPNLNAFIVVDKQEFRKDHNGNDIYWADYNWSSYTNDWFITSKIETTYNSYNNILREDSFRINDSTGEPINSVSSIVYYYSDSSVNLSPVYSTPLVAYPNPATDYFTVSLPDDFLPAVLNIFDSSGKQWIRQPIANKEVVPVKKFPSGIYFYRIEAGGKTHHGKLIKR